MSIARSKYLKGFAFGDKKNEMGKNGLKMVRSIKMNVRSERKVLKSSRKDKKSDCLETDELRAALSASVGSGTVDKVDISPASLVNDIEKYYSS